MEAREHIVKARALLAEANYLLAGDFLPGAGRGAYLAGFHAALALIADRTKREPKTHRGASSEFSRLAQSDNHISREHVAFLARTYELKKWADYEDSSPATRDEVMAAIALAGEMINAIESLLANHP